MELVSASINLYKTFPKPAGFKFYNFSANFDEFWNGVFTKNSVILPYQSLTLYSNVPLSSSNYIESYVDATKNFRFDTNMVVNATYNYENKLSSLVGATGRGQVKSAIIWDLKNSVPMAKVENADATQVAFTSFEVIGETGNWTYSGSTTDAKTGNKSFTGTVEFKTPLPLGTYKVSMWCKGSGNVTVNTTNTVKAESDWVYGEITVINPTTIKVETGSIKIDDLRLHPVNARMASNTFEPLKGVTSPSDENNIQTYYEYDSDERLKIIRDQDKNIVEQKIYKIGPN